VFGARSGKSEGMKEKGGGRRSCSDRNRAWHDMPRHAMHDWPRFVRVDGEGAESECLQRKFEICFYYVMYVLVFEPIHRANTYLPSLVFAHGP
jgi:hypothetical protein